MKRKTQNKWGRAALCSFQFPIWESESCVRQAGFLFFPVRYSIPPNVCKRRGGGKCIFRFISLFSILLDADPPLHEQRGKKDIEMFNSCISLTFIAEARKKKETTSTLGFSFLHLCELPLEIFPHKGPPPKCLNILFPSAGDGVQRQVHDPAGASRVQPGGLCAKDQG